MAMSFFRFSTNSLFLSLLFFSDTPVCVTSLSVTSRGQLLSNPNNYLQESESGTGTNAVTENPIQSDSDIPSILDTSTKSSSAGLPESVNSLADLLHSSDPDSYTTNYPNYSLVEVELGNPNTVTGTNFSISPTITLTTLTTSLIQNFKKFLSDPGVIIRPSVSTKQQAMSFSFMIFAGCMALLFVGMMFSQGCYVRDWGSKLWSLNLSWGGDAVWGIEVTVIYSDYCYKRVLSRSLFGGVRLVKSKSNDAVYLKLWKVLRIQSMQPN